MATQTNISDKYGAIARSVKDSGATACCDPGMRCCDPITKNLYGALETEGLPEKAEYVI
jgi:arsenite methyltransferase